MSEAIVKPFDLDVLKSKLKEKALGTLKPMLKDVVGTTLDWTAESCLIHENKYVKFLAPVVSGMKDPINQAIDQIGA